MSVRPQDGASVNKKIMLLETARRYNHDTECITFLKDFSYSKDDFARAGLQFEFINPIFEFSKGMKKLQLDDAEYALLIAINIFSADRPNVQDHELVERLQLPYVEALHSYLRINRPKVRLAAGQRPARFLPQPVEPGEGWGDGGYSVGVTGSQWSLARAGDNGGTAWV
uniref:NR LBD domain-containing protein n=1 Tax=Callorhinchus milii TaxID=7868 RepID=A0A4W3HIG4_CALMI